MTPVTTESVIGLKGGSLAPSDFQALAARWIDPETATRQLLGRFQSAEGAELVGRSGSGNYEGVAIPYVWPGQDRVREYRLRRDHPEYEGGKPRQKYVSPPGRGGMLYFSVGTDPTWLADTSLPAVIVEGEFKTIALDRLAHHGLGDAAERPRFLPIGIGGVWSWRGVVGKTVDSSGARVDEKGPIPDLARLQFRGRSVTILFDYDIAANDSVAAARAMLTKELTSRGAKVKLFAWPKDLPAGVKGIDDYLATYGPEDALRLIDNARPVKPTPDNQKSAARNFQAISEDCYRLKIESLGITFEIDRLRRDHNELIGELFVRCDLPGTRARDGNLSIADFNISSARARSERAKLLADRANTQGLDWLGMLEEFCQLVLGADRAGRPAVDLRELPRPEPDDNIEVDGFVLPRRHPTIIFGDGGASKSYTALYLAGRMTKQGVRVALFDWELAGEDHRDRLERLFGDDMPRILYARCERPLVYEADRLRRVVKDNNIDFAIFDSVAFACDGPPEAAESAARYYRAVRQIGGGSLHIAHITKGENADQKPFGSTFWHNGARSTWFAKVADSTAADEEMHVGFSNKKSNLGRLRPAIGFTVTFNDDRTTFRRSDIGANPDLAANLSLKQRIVTLLRAGTSMTREAIAEELDADRDTIKRTINRSKGLFTVIEGGRIALLEKQRVN